MPSIFASISKRNAKDLNFEFRHCERLIERFFYKTEFLLSYLLSAVKMRIGLHRKVT